MKKTAGQMGVGGRGKALRPAAGRMRGERMKHEKELRELSDMVDNLYIHGRLMRSGENKPRYYGSDILLFPNEVYTLKAIAQEEGDVYKRQDLNEILELSDSLIVMHGGEIVARCV